VPVIFSKVGNKGKGLIFLSHRERKTFDFLFKLTPKLKEVMLSKYLMAMHVGGFHKDIKDSDYIDKVLCVPGNAGSTEEIKDKLLPISSREFAPNYFYFSGEDKDIDLIVVTNAAKHRGPEKIILLAKELQRYKSPFKVVFVVSYPSKRNKSSMDETLEKRFWAAIDDDRERGRYAFMSVYAHEALYPLPRWFIAGLMKRSKYYLHTCEKEGESRSLGEALAAHCIVLAPSNLTGGAGALARENQNCLMYENMRMVGELMTDSKLTYVAPGFEEKANLAMNILREYCLSNGACSVEQFEDIIQKNDLSMLLPGHINRQYMTEANPDGQSDLINTKCINGFLDYACVDYKLSLYEAIRMTIFFFKKNMYRRVAITVKFVLWRFGQKRV